MHSSSFFGKKIKLKSFLDSAAFAGQSQAMFLWWRLGTEGRHLRKHQAVSKNKRKKQLGGKEGEEILLQKAKRAK